MLIFPIPKMKRAQSSVEFIVLVGLVLFAILIFVGITAGQVQQFRDQQEFEYIRDLGLSLQEEIALAAGVHDGYHRELVLPELLEGKFNYSIARINNTLSIVSENTHFDIRVPLHQGNFTKGTNVIEKRSEQIFVNE